MNGDTTAVINKAFAEGDPDAQEVIFAKLGQEIHRLAARLMAHERPGHTWRPSGLVNEYVAGLLVDESFGVEDKAQFFRFARRKMLQLLIDYARHKGSQRAGGGHRRSSLEDRYHEIESNRIGDNPVTVARFNAALEELEAANPRQFEILSGSIVCHLDPAEMSVILDLSESTVYSELQKARAFLYFQLSDAE